MLIEQFHKLPLGEVLPLLNRLKVPEVRIFLSFCLSLFLSEADNKTKEHQEVCQFLWLSRMVFTYQKLFIAIQELVRFCICQATTDKGELCALCRFAIPVHSLEILQQVLLWDQQLQRISNPVTFVRKDNIELICLKVTQYHHSNQTMQCKF